MSLSKDEVMAGTTEVVGQMVSDWDLDDIRLDPETRLGEDLGFTSVDVLHLLASLDMHFDCRLPYEQLLMKDGKYVGDLSLDTLASFIHETTDHSAQPSGPQKM